MVLKSSLHRFLEQLCSLVDISRVTRELWESWSCPLHYLFTFRNDSRCWISMECTLKKVKHSDTPEDAVARTERRHRTGTQLNDSTIAPKPSRRTHFLPLAITAAACYG